jgi:hypothetical protein
MSSKLQDETPSRGRTHLYWSREGIRAQAAAHVAQPANVLAIGQCRRSPAAEIDYLDQIGLGPRWLPTDRAVDRIRSCRRSSRTWLVIHRLIVCSKEAARRQQQSCIEHT